MGIDAIKKMVEAIFDDLSHFKEKYESAYASLVTIKDDGIKELQAGKKDRSANSQKEIDRQIEGLNIVYKKEHAKHESLLKSIDSAIKAAKLIKSHTNVKGYSITTIQEELNNLIPFIETVYTESKFLIGRIEIGSYTLGQQLELKEKGLDYPKGKEKKFLEKELRIASVNLNNINPDAKVTLGAFNRARGVIDQQGNRTGIEGKLSDLKERKKNEWLKPTTLDLKRQRDNNAIIRQHLTDITPDKLHTIPNTVQQKIKGYIGGVSISREEHYKKGDPYNESDLEKLIYAKTGMSREDILHSENLFPNPEGLTNKKTEETAQSPAEIKSSVKRKQKSKAPADVITDTASVANTSSLADVISDTASVANTSSPANITSDTASVANTSSLADVISDTASVTNTTSPGNRGGGKKRRISIRGRGGSIGGASTGGGSQSPIEEIKPKVEYGGGSQSPGEVSDEMLKIIEQAVFNGTARAFSQFSNSPISAPSEFSDSAIDKIGNTVYEAMKKALDYYSASPALNMVLFGIDPSVMKLLKDELGGLSSTGGGTGDMDKLAEELRKSRESNENLAKMQEARRKKAVAEKRKKDQEAEKEKKRIVDPNSPESIAKKKKEADAAERAQKKKDKEDPNSPENIAKKKKQADAAERAQKRKDKEDPNSLENIAKAEEKKRKEEAKKAKEDKAKLKAEREADPFRKRLKTIFKEGEQELSFLYAKTDAFAGWIPGFNDAILKARKSALETLRKGYEAFDEKYAASGSAFQGMWASLQAMYSVSPFTVIVAGLTTIGILLGKTIFNAAQKVNTQIKEIAAELGTSNRQSYEMFKNAMNAQTQFENLHASLRDVMDAQKGILGDSGILLRTNDKALSAIADNAKNIGLSVESAGAFYENLRMKGAGDTEANNVMTASLELADKRGFSPQSIVDDIAQNAEFASKYFSKIKTDSKSAHRNLIETNIQVKNLGLNFQKASKMTQHLLSFEQSITAEVEASVALGTHVDIGKARELLLQDDVAGAMTQMMNAIPGGYEGFQSQDFAQRQLSANALGLEVSELERSLYLREKIKLSNSEDLELAMRHDDYLKKIAGTNDELYRTELNKVQAAERYNTSIEKLSVSFRYALAPVLEAVVPVVDLLAGAINRLAGIVKSIVGGITGANSDAAIGGGGIKTPDMYQMGGGALMATVMGGQLLKMMRGPAGAKLGEAVGKVKGSFDTLTGTLGTKTNPMYVISLGGGVGGVGGGIGGGKFVNGKFRSQEVLNRAESIRNIRNAKTSTPKPGFLKGILSNAKGLNFGSIVKNTLKTGGVASAILGVLDYADRKGQGQSTAQAASGAISGGLGSIGGAALGAAIGTMLLPGIGTIIGGMLGGYAGHTAGSRMSDSFFNKKPSSSYETQPFQYQGMGLSATGSIYGGVNKPTAKGIPVETSMVDTTPTTLKPNFSNPFNTTPNYGTTSMSRNSAIVNTTSKSVSASAMLQNTINNEKQKTDDALIKEAQEQTKLMQEMIKRLNQPALAFFNDEGRKQTASYIRVKGTP
jgi:hypothetical protein